jgi:hypothetical protein
MREEPAAEGASLRESGGSEVAICDALTYAYPADRGNTVASRMTNCFVSTKTRASPEHKNTQAE